MKVLPDRAADPGVSFSVMTVLLCYARGWEKFHFTNVEICGNMMRIEGFFCPYNQKGLIR